MIETALRFFFKLVVLYIGHVSIQHSTCNFLRLKQEVTLSIRVVKYIRAEGAYTNLGKDTVCLGVAN